MLRELRREGGAVGLGGTYDDGAGEGGPSSVKVDVEAPALRALGGRSDATEDERGRGLSFFGRGIAPPSLTPGGGVGSGGA